MFFSDMFDSVATKRVGHVHLHIAVKRMTRLCLMLFFWIIFCGRWTACLAYFLGGASSWMTAPGNKVRLTYRTAWEKGTGPCGLACSPVNIGSVGSSLSPELSSVEWISDYNNVTNTFSNVKYTLTSVSKRNVSGWEQGESIIMYDAPSSQKFTVTFLGLRWISNSLTTNISNVGLMSTRIDARIRNDTGRPNSSPFTSQPAYFGVPLGCTRTFRLPVIDPDNDKVKCRLASQTECGSACTNVPDASVWIDEVKCTLTVYAFSTLGYQPDHWYRVALVVEDFPDFSISLGSDIFTHEDSLSAIALQISILVVMGSCSGQSGPHYVKPTIPNFATASVDVFDIITRKPVATQFYIQVADITQMNTTEVMMSGPTKVMYSYCEDDLSIVLNRSDVIRVNMTWLSDIPPQIGNQQFCIWAVSGNGITSDERCLTSMVGDDADNCQSGKVICENNGTCVNLFMVPQERCVCQRGYTSSNCSQAVHCSDNPCRNNGTCTETKTGFFCQCPPEYTGVNCDVKIPLCWSSPCLNQGTCLNMNDTVRCICQTTFTGTFCEQSLITKPDLTTVSVGNTKPDPTTVSVGNTKPNSSTVSVGNTKPDPSTVSLGNTNKDPTTVSVGNTKPDSTTVSMGNIKPDPSTVSMGNTKPYPTTVSVGNTKPDPTTVSVGNTNSDPTTVSVGNAKPDPTTVSVGNTKPDPTTVSVGNTKPDTTTVSVGNTIPDSTTVSVGNTKPDPSTASMEDTSKMWLIVAGIGSTMAIGLGVISFLIIRKICKQNDVKPFKTAMW